MSAKKQTEEEREISRAQKIAKDCVEAFRKRQEWLFIRLSQGDKNVKKCKCGKYFDQRIFNDMNPNVKKLWCTKCPLRPNTRDRKVFLKSTSQWVIRKEKRR